MSADTLPAIPEFLLRQKEQAKAALDAQRKAKEDADREAAEENVRLLNEAVRASVGPEAAQLLACLTPIDAHSILATFELALAGHRPIFCQFSRKTTNTLGATTRAWERDVLSRVDGKDLVWEVEGREENCHTATLGEALLLADHSAPTSPEDDDGIPF